MYGIQQQRLPIELFYLYFMLQNIFQSVFCLSSNELCLNKTCSGCIAGSLSCQEGGLVRLPDRLSPDIQSMILMGHKFHNPILTSDNFSMYSQQNINLQRLTLRNCGIQSIHPGTFYLLKSLQQLDLSQNQVKIIEKGTFEGLQLDFLRLDENFGLRIEEGAFEGTSIVSLSINQCGLKTLSYDVLLPLINSKQLKNLHLSGNQLTTIESRLEPIFLQLQSLSLEQNPFTCDCKLSWLVSVLNRRQVQRRTRGLLMLNDDVDHIEANLLSSRSNNLIDLNQHNAPLDGDLLKPLCHNPRRLIGKSIESLTASDFYCGTPRLQIVEIDLGQLTNFYQRQNYQMQQLTENSKQENNAALTVTVRCYVKGSPELQIDWYRPVNYNNNGEIYQRKDSNSYSFSATKQQLIRVPNTKLLRSGGIELKLSRQIDLEDREIFKSNNFSTSSTEKLICYATDSNGNTSAEIVFHWPTFENLKMMSNHPVNTQTNIKNHQNNGKFLDENIGNTDKKKTTNHHSTNNHEIMPGWYTVLQDDPENLLFQKQFSVLEMIGAVVGTFTVTLIFFIFGYCLLRFHRKSRYKVRSKILLHHTTSENSYRNFSPISENLKSQPYSVTNNHLLKETSNTNNDTNTNMSYTASVVPNTIINSYTTSNLLTGNGTLVNDYGGVKRLPYVTATYEPINGTGEFQTSTGYSESQTYDLPRIFPTHSPPAIPLPPLPNGFMNNAISSDGISRLNGNENENCDNRTNNNTATNNNNNNSHASILMTTIPYITRAPSVNDVNRCVNASVLSPLLMNDTRTLSAAMSAAVATATLNLRMKQQATQSIPMNSNNNNNNNNNHNQSNNSTPQLIDNTTNDNIIVQNQLLNLTAHQDMLNRQLNDRPHYKWEQ